MKKILILLIAIIYCNILNAQVGQDDFGFNNQSELERTDDTNTQTDSSKMSVKPVITKWGYKHDGVYKYLIPRDTLINQIHNFNPLFRKSISNTYLGNLNSPYIENIFIKRRYRTDFLFLKPFDAYLSRPEEQVNINTTTPYTDITFKTGGRKRKGEDFLKVLHTQNINPFWNIGINFNISNGDGQYTHQKSKIYDFALSSSYEKERFKGYWSINQNVGKIEENGGIADETLVRDTSVDSRNIPINLLYPETKFYNFNFYTYNQYYIGNSKEVIHNGDTLSFYPTKIIYSLRIDENQRKFKEESLSKDFFENNYFNESSTLDKSFYSVYDHNFKFVWNKKPEHYSPGLYIGLSNKSEKYGYQTPEVNENLLYKKYNTQYLTSGIFHQDSAKINYDFNIKYAMSGKYSGDMNIKGQVQWNFTKNNYFEFSASYKDKAVDFFSNEYYSNHYQWKEDFEPERNLQFGVKLINKNRSLDIGFLTNNINNFMFFGTNALPSQSSSSIRVLTAYINKDFRLGKLHFNQSVYYQKSSNTNVLDLPQLSIYSNNYFEDWFFKNALQFMIGVDIFYNSKFYTPFYNPATSSFYNQREEKFGGYPKIDLFANIRIKRALLFIKYEHLNFKFGNREYFSTKLYPINPGFLKYGVRWYFYD